MTRAVESKTLAKVSWRILPLAIAIYVVAYIDRTNIGFAALTMNRELGLSATMFGWAAGIFFIGYFLFEIPSNVILARVGARRWIARIMVTWAAASFATAFARGPASLLVLRFILGVAEAGLFPGMILYFTYWFPVTYRARAFSTFMIAMPVSNAVAAAVSGGILQLDGLWGIAGWRWIFILEAVPAFVLAFFVLRFLTDRPSGADWLDPEEKEWLETTLTAERRAIERTGRMTLLQGLTDRRILILSGIYFANTIVSYSMSVFLPLIVKGLGLSNLATGFVTAIPFVLGTGAMILCGISSDRRRELRWHFAIASVVAGAGLVGLGLTAGFYLAIASMSVAAMGLYASKAVFWPMPSQFLTGTAAAGGIALVNSIGNLGGFAGPYLLGWIKDSTGSYAWGLYILAGCAVASAAAAFLYLRPGPALATPRLSNA